MNEYFLHYLWQFQYFEKNELKTTEGEEVLVLKPGMLNSNSGPDFSHGKVKIGAIEWAGSVEIHIKSSGWNDHHHDVDAAYENVILHVVWQDDKPVVRKDGSILPTIELKNRVTDSLINEYKKLITSSFAVPCSKLLDTVSDLSRFSMLDKVLAQRLEEKALFIKELFSRNKHDWNETCYQLLAKNFGFKVNSEPFLQLTKNLPYKLLQKHADNQLQVEALLFGVAGFLNGGMKDPYFISLQKEFMVLVGKYQLDSKKIDPSQWRFLRLRPANFPTIRIAQFAAMIISSKNIFSRILEATSYSELIRIFDSDQSLYWGSHYRFGKKSKASVHGLGMASIDNLIINSVAPLLAAYGVEHGETSYIDKAQEILQQMPAEQNKIIRTWRELNWKVENAFDSQALIQLFNAYCQQKNCLNCNIGASLLKPHLRK
jgi:hypothetical protein